MPYIRRDPQTLAIVAFQIGPLSEAQQAQDHWLPVSGNETDVQAFLAEQTLNLPQAAQQQALDQLAQSDLDMARITEDLIDVLINRGVIQFIDFPEAAQSKLLGRRTNRQVLQKRLSLLDETDTEDRLI